MIKIILISPCNFNGYFLIKISKSSADLFWMKLWRSLNGCFYDHFWCLDCQYAAVDVLSITSKIKTRVSSLNYLSGFSENLRKSLYKIEYSGSLENCDIFSTYYFSYVQGYIAALSGGNKRRKPAACVWNKISLS